MTGAPAETWRRFTFSKTPWWAFWVGGILLSTALSERTTGYLPLTRASVKTLRTVRWTFAGLLPFAFFLWVIGIIVASVSSSDVNGAIFELLFLLGLGALFAAIVGTFIGRSVVGPAGKVLKAPRGQAESLVELRNVHPAFVAGVQQLQQVRATQSIQAPVP